MAYRAEYLWIDGTEPTAEIRSKTRILQDGAEPGIWGYDGSSTNQATGDNSDVVLKPVFSTVGALRGTNGAPRPRTRSGPSPWPPVPMDSAMPSP